MITFRRGTLILGTNSAIPFGEVKQIVKDTIRASEHSSWMLVEVNEEWYLMRFLQCDKQYLGGICPYQNVDGGKRRERQRVSLFLSDRGRQTDSG